MGGLWGQGHGYVLFFFLSLSHSLHHIEKMPVVFMINSVAGDICMYSFISVKMPEVDIACVTAAVDGVGESH